MTRFAHGLEKPPYHFGKVNLKNFNVTRVVFFIDRIRTICLVILTKE
jgi:hypothetical protein